MAILGKKLRAEINSLWLGVDVSQLRSGARAQINGAAGNIRGPNHVPSVTPSSFRHTAVRETTQRSQPHL